MSMLKQLVALIRTWLLAARCLIPCIIVRSQCRGGRSLLSLTTHTTVLPSSRGHINFVSQ